MSVDVLRQLVLEERTLSIAELGVLLGGLSRSAAYRYLEATELRFGQLVCLYRHAESDAVRDAIDAALITGTGRQVMRLPEAADLDGDGDIDTQDALAGANKVIGKASCALQVMLDTPDDELSQARMVHAREALAAALHASASALAVLDWLDQHAPKRRKAKAVPRG